MLEISTKVFVCTHILAYIYLFYLEKPFVSMIYSFYEVQRVYQKKQVLVGSSNEDELGPFLHSTASTGLLTFHTTLNI
jgi:hypothetical protein